MSVPVTQKNVPARRRPPSPNTISFPRGLRDAIPDLPTCVGRVLKLDSVEGQPSQTRLFGARIHLKLTVKETGKLTGEFVLRADLGADAARALAATLNGLADQAEQSEPI